MYIAHGPISYIFNEILQKKNISKLTKHEHILVMILSILFGILPDIDLALLSITNIPPFLHHSVFTHSAILYISLWILLNILISLFKKILNDQSRKVFRDELLNVIKWSFLIGSMSHLISDLLFSYSQILYPIEKQYTILGHIFSKNYFSNLLFSPSFPTEILFLNIFILFIYTRFLKSNKISKYCIYLSIFLSSIYLMFSMYMNLNTYNKTYTIYNSKVILDADYDGILDLYDSDTNNNGILNIYELDKEEASTFLKNISNERYFVSSNNTSQERIKGVFGAFTSYRVISQAYNEQNLPIEPVLREYSNLYTLQLGYTTKIQYSDLLKTYILENGHLITYKEGEYTGNIFVVLKEGEFKNMGILVQDKYFSTVLPKDTKLRLHTKEELLEEYPNSEIKVVNMNLGVFVDSH